MNIKVGAKALIHYKLENNDTKELIEMISPEKPVTFVFGENKLLPDFEKQMIGLMANESFDFVIEADLAYGPVDPYAIFDIPLDTFEVDGKIDDKMIQIGNKIPMTDNEGNKHLGKITKIHPDSITMDFNHPLAGANLHFAGKVIEVKI